MKQTKKSRFHLFDKPHELTFDFLFVVWQYPFYNCAERNVNFLFFVDSLYFCYFWMLLTNFIQFFHSLHKIETLTFVEFLFIFSISNQIQLQTYIYFSLHSHIHNDILSNSEIWTDFVNSAIFAFVFLLNNFFVCLYLVVSFVFNQCFLIKLASNDK